MQVVGIRSLGERTVGDVEGRPNVKRSVKAILNSIKTPNSTQIDTTSTMCVLLACVRCDPSLERALSTDAHTHLKLPYHHYALSTPFTRNHQLAPTTAYMCMYMN